MILQSRNPINTPESQICLALQILCGFSVEEIADAFRHDGKPLKNGCCEPVAISGKTVFRYSRYRRLPSETRLDIVLRTSYLLFNGRIFFQVQ